MKLKLDFITNSSSASFVLYIESTENNYDEFIKNWKLYMIDFIDNYSFQLAPKIKSYRKLLNSNYERDLELKKKIEDGTATKQEEKWFNLSLSNRNIINPKEMSDHEILKIILGIDESHIRKINNQIFTIDYFTSMFNNLLDDVPQWMLELILLHNINSKDLLKYGIKNVHLEIQNQQEH